MSFDVLGCDDARWPALIERLDRRRRDIHFLPSYGAVYRRTYGFDALLAVLDEPDGLVIQPFVRRPLNPLPFLRDQAIEKPFFDVANPYGYGGPLVEARDGEQAVGLFRRFHAELGAHFRADHVAAEFTSLHPLLGNDDIVRAANVVTVEDQKDIVYVDLTLSEDELWQQTRRGHKSSINKAKKSGVSIDEVAPTADDFATFNKLYFATMDRNQAAARWYFPEDYFRNCWELLGADRVAFFFARHEGNVIAAWIVMHAFDTAYYHFGGSSPDFYHLRANNLMVHEVALWAKRRGYRALHLGGGVTSAPGDPLFVFKSGYAHKTARLRSYGRIHDEATYAELCRLKQAHEIAATGQLSSSGFFPLYRR
jgi:GNAT acetyltransferase-like protein